MRKHPLPTPERLQELLEDAGDTVRWKVNRGAARAGDEVRRVTRTGYLMLYVDGTNLYVHRVLWAMRHGKWPEGQLDHKDRDRLNNHPDNLREATPSDNNCNQGLSSNNTTGYKGVYKDKYTGRWYAKVVRGGRQIYGRRVATREEAFQERLNLERQYHGEFTGVHV